MCDHSARSAKRGANDYVPRLVNRENWVGTWFTLPVSQPVSQVVYYEPLLV